MKAKVKELAVQKLRYSCDTDQFDFETTADLSPLEEVVGQERAVQAIDFGVDIKNYGFNIYVLGPGGAGRTSTITEAIERRAKDLPTPDDWCYVYNFSAPDQPNAIRLPAGKAKVLQVKIDNLIRLLKKEIPDALSSEDFQKERNQIIQKYQEKQNKQLLQLDKKAKGKGFTLQKGPMGFILVPVKDGQVLTPEQYEQLSTEEKEIIDRQGKILQEDLDNMLHEIRSFERQVKREIEKLERNVVKFAVGYHIDELKEEFKAYDEVIIYLNQAEDDLLANISDLKSSEESETKSSLLPSPGSYFERFRVNVIVDNSKTKGAPVVVETNPTYNNLIGRIDKKTHMGALITDFTMIKAGALHRANGGFLIVEAEHIFGTPFGWDALKRTLKNQTIKITDLSEEYSFVSTKTLEPEPIPLETKVVLIGRAQIYYLLLNLDTEFRELFKVKADFNVKMKRTKRNVLKYAQFISSRCQAENLLHFEKNAVARVVEYGSELVGDQTKLSTRFADICDLAREANFWAKKNNHKIVNRQDVQQAINAKKYRSNRIEELSQEMIENGTIFIDLKGEEVGQVNGLAVMSLGDYSFGKPSRITVRTFLGKGGVIAIDREVKMSGPIHDKGVLILSGYLNGKFGQNKQLSMSASITFEQSYEGIEGDSASSTELYGLLSSLSGYPIKQGIAVTGSVNQLGEIQPIGGVTEKIEGFFDICKAKGLTGEQGVLIPKVNIKNLMVKEEIVEAVHQGKFHIYPISTIDEGIAILTGVPAGKQKKDGTYPKNTVYWAVDNRLKEMAELLKESERETKKKKKPKKKSD